MSKRFQVVYVDKFRDVAEAELARLNLQQTFRLSDQALTRLSSGDPVVVKKYISRQEAERFEAAIKEAGGCCWIQPMSEDGRFRERRTGRRRQLMDRREIYRGSSILPDRRMGVGRRASD